MVKVGRHRRGSIQLRLIDNLSPCLLRGMSISRQFFRLLPEAGFLSTHKVSERSHSGARWNLIPKAEASRCNVPDSHENYGF